ncbi:hypothetical protein, partial [Sedimenticola sp.]|uniref:hypothetical protein n=1 Tax=Sedimenticola sp. TaxID=1940285 RepID=UPI003D126CBD
IQCGTIVAIGQLADRIKGQCQEKEEEKRSATIKDVPRHGFCEGLGHCYPLFIFPFVSNAKGVQAALGLHVSTNSLI